MERHVGGSIHRLHNLLCRDNNRFPHGEMVDRMTGSHGYILCWLHDHAGQDVFQKDLEKQLKLRRSSVTQVLQVMEQNGLVERVPVEKDARLKKLVLTPKAEQLDRIIRADIAETERRIVAGIDEAELDAFCKTLEKIGQNLERGLYPAAQNDQQEDR